MKHEIVIKKSFFGFKSEKFVQQTRTGGAFCRVVGRMSQSNYIFGTRSYSLNPVFNAMGHYGGEEMSTKLISIH